MINTSKIINELRSEWIWGEFRESVLAQIHYHFDIYNNVFSQKVSHVSFMMFPPGEHLSFAKQFHNLKLSEMLHTVSPFWKVILHITKLKALRNLEVKKTYLNFLKLNQNLYLKITSTMQFLINILYHSTWIRNTWPTVYHGHNNLQCSELKISMVPHIIWFHFWVFNCRKQKH